MLRGLRKASSNWLGKTIMAVVMGVLIVSFGIWGIADIFRGFGQSTLATVGRTEISINEFRQLYTDKLQQIGRQFGRWIRRARSASTGRCCSKHYRKQPLTRTPDGLGSDSPMRKRCG